MSMDYLTNNRFDYNGKTYYVSFVSSYRGESDYSIIDNKGIGYRGDMGQRFSVDQNGTPASYGKAYPKGSIERKAYATYKRAMWNEFSMWAARNDFPNRGAARKAIA